MNLSARVVVVVGLLSLAECASLPCLAQDTSSSGPSPWHHSAVFLPQSRLELLRERVASHVEPTFSAYARLKTSADCYIDLLPTPPSHWFVPYFYENPKGHKEGKVSLATDANAAYELALCYRMTGDARYARSAARIIDAWASGVQSASTEEDSRLAWSYHFPAMIFAADLVASTDVWYASRQTAFKRFVRERSLPLNTMASQNNWGNWGLVLVMASSAYLDDQPLFEAGVSRWKEFIESQVAEDGSLSHEVTRAGGGTTPGRAGLWYSHFSLMPQTLAAEIARVNGTDLFDYVSPSGRTLRMAFDRLAEWSRYPERFPFYQGAPDELSKPRYVSYFEILNTHWANVDASALLAEMRPLTANHSAPHLSFTHGDLP
jgi:hypothetical protein